MKHFEELKVLGDGAFGVVTKCRDKETNAIVAVKKLKARYSNFEECLQEKEVKSLRKIKHDNVEKLLQVFRENEHLFLVFELLNESLLKTITSKSSPFTNEEVRFIMQQIFAGLSVIHKQGFFHRDMKPDNLLWGDNDVLKIADFGLAREIRSRPPYTEYISTRWYRAPEIILRHPFYNSPVDIWAAGCIMAELFMLKPIFQGTSETDQLYKICSVLGAPTKESWHDGVHLALKKNLRLPQCSPQNLQAMMPNASQDAIDLLKSIFQFDPAKRPSASQAMQHPFFSGVKIAPSLSSSRRNEISAPNEQSSIEKKQNEPVINSHFSQKILNDALYSPTTAPPSVAKNTVMDQYKTNTSNHSKSALVGAIASSELLESPKRTPSYLKGAMLQGMGVLPRPQNAQKHGLGFGSSIGMMQQKPPNQDLFDSFF